VPLEFHRAQDLPPFSGERAGVEMESQPRQLHRDGRSARARASGSRKVPGRAQDRHWVHTRMLREIFILELHGRIDQRG
jgi:hypothetical protein